VYSHERPPSVPVNLDLLIPTATSAPSSSTTSSAVVVVDQPTATSNVVTAEEQEAQEGGSSLNWRPTSSPDPVPCLPRPRYWQLVFDFFFQLCGFEQCSDSLLISLKSWSPRSKKRRRCSGAACPACLITPQSSPFGIWQNITGKWVDVTNRWTSSALGLWFLGTQLTNYLLDTPISYVLSLSYFYFKSSNLGGDNVSYWLGA